jgi:hypothetical protein
MQLGIRDTVAARDKFGRRRTFALVRNIFDDVEGVYQQSACCEIGGMRQEEDYYRLRYIPMVGEEGPALFLDDHRIVDGYPFCEILGVSKLPEASKILRSRTKRRGSHGNAFSLMINIFLR